MMNNGFRKFLFQAARYFFGEFNGVQVFLYPGLLLYWLDSESLVYVIGGLFSVHVHYFPISIFFILSLYIAFILLKKYTMHFKDSLRHTQVERNNFKAFVVDLHEKLLIVLVILMLAYVFAAFMKYFYGIQVPMKQIFAMATRVICVFLIIYYYLTHLWLEPIRKMGHSPENSRLRAMHYIKHNPFSFLRYSIVVTLMIVLSSRLYYGIVAYFLHPLFTSVTGGGDNVFTFIMIPFDGGYALVYNVFVIGAAFMISNLFFAPLVFVVHYLAKLIHPLKERYLSNA